jgi:hypothetical protein
MSRVLIIDDLCPHALDATETADFYELVVEKHHKTTTRDHDQAVSPTSGCP